MTISLSDAVAWWGAIVATVVLAWDIYKWRKSQANICVSASPNMQPINQLTHDLEDKIYVFVEVVNNGDKVTTLTHLVVAHYESFLDRLRRRPLTQGFIPTPVGSQGLPFELAPGKRWTGMIDQTDLINKCGSGGYYYCGVYYSGRNKPVLAAVQFT